MVVASPKLRLKTDNHSLGDKCLLRRELIASARNPDPKEYPRAHAVELEPLRVLDLFAGEGNIWTEMRREPRYDLDLSPEEQIHGVQVERYTPVDVASRQAGQLKFKITPRLIAALNGDKSVDEYAGTDLTRYNVVDVDTFGDPFAIWRELLFRIKQPTAVFLTRGKVTYGSGRMPISKLAQKIMGMPAHWNVPGKIELLNAADEYQLKQFCPTARITIGLKTDHPRVDYYGLLVEPFSTAATS
jgi:hypothetical protein